jgi:hypothetical protein
MTHLTAENSINSNTTTGTFTWTMVKKIDVAIQNTGGHLSFCVNLP